MIITDSRNDSLKSQARSLAATLYLEDDVAALVGVASSAAGSAAPISSRSTVTPPASPHTGPETVGIWRATPTPAGLAFTREPPNDSWRAWADVEMIPPKGTLPRIALIGESVARGFLCEPHLSPAAALRRRARDASGDALLEIVDLACSGLTLPELCELLDRSHQLSADIAVVFAGNNWVRNNWFACTPEGILPAFHEVPALLRASGSWAAVADLATRSVALQAREGIGRLAAIAAERRLQLLVVIPEFNLAEWRSIHRRVPLIFDQAAATAWHASSRAADAALERGNLDEAEAHAAEMHRLDAGTSAAAYDIRAECCRRRGNLAEARRLFEASRATILSLPLRREPSCYAVIQATMREECRRLGLPVVDLPACFAAHLGGELPDRRLFLDFCHLTIEGMGVAMDAVLEALVGVLRLPSTRWSPAEDPPPIAVADSHLTAALFNATLGQPLPIIQYHCRKAVSAIPESIPLRAFLDAYVRRAPAVLCQTYELAVAGSEPLPALQKFMRDMLPTYPARVHFDFATALQQSIDAATSDGTPAVTELVQREHGLTVRPVSLLDAFGRCTRMMEIEEQWLLRSAYFRAFSPYSSFQFACDGCAAVHVSMTYRTSSHVAPDDEVKVGVNTQLVGSLVASSSWRSASVRVPVELLTSALNVFWIEWPAGTADARVGIERAARAVELAVCSSAHDILGIFPWWGDVQTLSAHV